MAVATHSKDTTHLKITFTKLSSFSKRAWIAHSPGLRSYCLEVTDPNSKKAIERGNAKLFGGAYSEITISFSYYLPTGILPSLSDYLPNLIPTFLLSTYRGNSSPEIRRRPRRKSLIQEQISPLPSLSRRFLHTTGHTCHRWNKIKTRFHQIGIKVPSARRAKVG